MSPVSATESVIPDLRFSGFEGQWVKHELSDIASIQRGRFSPRPRNNPIYYGGEIPFVQTSDVVNSAGRIQKFTQTLNEKGLKVSKLFPSGTILITIAANIGFTGVLQIDMACPDSLVGISCNPETHNYFLNYLLEKEQPRMDYLAVEAAQKNINIGFLEIYVLTLPTLPEQRKIADFLTAVDGRIQQLIQKKALLEDYKKGVMQQLFTQAIRFQDDHGNDFPDWEEKKLGEFAKLYQPKTISQTDLTTEGYTVYGANGVIGKYHSFNHENPQVTVTCRGSTCGVIGYTEPNCWITGNAMVVNLDEHPDSTKTFVYHALCATDLRYLITGSGQPQITGNLKGHKIGYPSPDEQTKIADFLSAIDHKIESVATQITDTQFFKRGLLQQMFV